MRRVALIKDGVLVAIATFAILVAMELGARIVFESDTVLNVNVGGYKTYHPVRRVKLKENYRVNGISINSYGILGPKINLDKENRIRLLTIGDSVTFHPPDRNYSKVLEKKLQSFYPREEIEVIVGAVPGYSSYEAMNWYDEFLHKLDADVCIIYLGWNDIGQYHPFGLKYKNEALSYQERSFSGWMMENFYLLRVPYFFIGRYEKSKPVDLSALKSDEKQLLDDFSPDHYEKNVITLISKLQDDGSKVYLLTLAGLITYEPTKEEILRMHFPRGMGKKLEIYKAVYQKYCEALDRVAKKTGVSVIDLRKLIRTEKRRKIFRDTMHITVKGAERFGVYIAEKMKEDIALIVDARRKNLVRHGLACDCTK